MCVVPAGSAKRTVSGWHFGDFCVREPSSWLCGAHDRPAGCRMCIVHTSMVGRRRAPSSYCFVVTAPSSVCRLCTRVRAVGPARTEAWLRFVLVCYRAQLGLLLARSSAGAVLSVRTQFGTFTSKPSLSFGKVTVELSRGMEVLWLLKGNSLGTNCCAPTTRSAFWTDGSHAGTHRAPRPQARACSSCLQLVVSRGQAAAA